MPDQDQPTSTPTDTPTPSPNPDAPVAGPQAPPDLQPDAQAPTPQAAGIQPSAAPTIAGPASVPTHDAGSKWANVVKGALGGLLMGGAPGFVAGLADPNGVRQAYKNRQAEDLAHVQQSQANVNFTNAQAASLQAQTAMRLIENEHAPEQFREQAQAADADMVKSLIARGAKPTIVTSSATPQALQAGLQSISDANGGVPPLATFHVGDKLVSFNLDTLGQDNSMLSDVNKARVAQGLTALSTAAYSQMPNAAKTKAIADSLTFFNPVSSVKNADDQLQQYKNFLATAQMQPDESPDKAEIVSKLQDAVTRLSGSKDHKDAYAAAATAAKAAAKGGVAVYAVDKDGNTLLTSKNEALAGGMSAIRPVKESDIKADQHDIRVLNDVALKANRVADTSSALDQPGDQRSIIASALADGELGMKAHGSMLGLELPTGGINSFLNAGILNKGTQQSKDYVIAVLSLREASMGLQKVLTGSARASESQIKALQQTIPGYEGGSSMANNKLDAFTANLGQLRQGIPKIPGMSTVEVKSQAKPKQNGNSFSDSLGKTVTLPTPIR